MPSKKELFQLECQKAGAGERDARRSSGGISGALPGGYLTRIRRVAFFRPSAETTVIFVLPGLSPSTA